VCVTPSTTICASSAIDQRIPKHSGAFLLAPQARRAAHYPE
jgi:hypothetical protein